MAVYMNDKYIYIYVCKCKCIYIYKYIIYVCVRMYMYMGLPQLYAYNSGRSMQHLRRMSVSLAQTTASHADGLYVTLAYNYAAYVDVHIVTLCIYIHICAYMYI